MSEQNIPNFFFIYCDKSKPCFCPSNVLQQCCLMCVCVFFNLLAIGLYFLFLFLFLNIYII